MASADIGCSVRIPSRHGGMFSCMTMQVPLNPSPELETRLRGALLPGERLLWSASPAPHKLLWGFAGWVFAIPWTGFALFQESRFLPLMFATLESRNPADWISGIVFPLFLLPFVLSGFVMLWEPFRVLRNARRTVYGLTDMRMLRLLAGPRFDSTSIMFSQMGRLGVSADARGYGTLFIKKGATRDSLGNRKIDRFDVPGIANVAQLKDLLTEHLARARSEGTRL